MPAQTGASQGKMVYLYTVPHAWKRANAAALVGAGTAPVNNSTQA